VKYFFVFLSFYSTFIYAQEQPDFIITNGRIVDGTGNSWFRADVAVKGDRIMAVQKGLVQRFPTIKTIDAKKQDRVTRFY